MDVEQVRRFALSLPGTSEQPHHDRSSFRVGKGIFVTVPPDEQHVHVLVAEEDVRAAVAEHPEEFEELWWGKRLSGVRVRLADAPADLVLELVEEAWRRRAPEHLHRHPGAPDG